MDKSSKDCEFQYTSTFSPFELFRAKLLSDDLSSDVDLVGHVEDVQSDVVRDVGKVNLFVRIEPKSVELQATE